MKTCTKCKLVLPPSKYYKDKRTKDGLYSSCKDCHSKNKKSPKIAELIRNNPTPKRVAFYHFSSIISRLKTCNSYKDIKCLMSRADMEGFVEKNWDTYMKLHNTWEKNNFDRKLSPTIDRIDPKKNYAVENIRFLSMIENAMRPNLERKEIDIEPHLFKLKTCAKELKRTPTALEFINWCKSYSSYRYLKVTIGWTEAKKRLALKIEAWINHKDLSTTTGQRSKRSVVLNG